MNTEKIGSETGNRLNKGDSNVRTIYQSKLLWRKHHWRDETKEEERRKCLLSTPIGKLGLDISVQIDAYLENRAYTESYQTKQRDVEFFDRRRESFDGDISREIQL